MLAGSFTIDTHVWLQMSLYFTNLSRMAQPHPPRLYTSRWHHRWVCVNSWL